jgi:arylsulfatase A-like enzyme
LQGEHAEKEIRQIRATYYGLVSKVDHYVGGLLDFLKSTGRYDDTLIILASDHGELLGDQWLFGKRGYFDSGYHVPLIIRDPDQPGWTRGRTVDNFTESVDVMPTILDWLGLDAPRQCDGCSLLPWIEGHTPANWRTEAHWEYDFRDVENPGLERELGIAMDHCQLNVIRNDRYKYVHFTDLPPLFFDLENDPAEMMNLAQDERVANAELSLASRMLSWRMANDERELTAINVSRDKIFSR